MRLTFLAPHDKRFELVPEDEVHQLQRDYYAGLRRDGPPPPLFMSITGGTGIPIFCSKLKSEHLWFRGVCLHCHRRILKA